MKLSLALLLTAVLFAAPADAKITPGVRHKIDAVLGTAGEYVTTEDTYRFTFPRTDVRLVVRGRQSPTLIGVESWAAFTSDPHHGGTLLVAELALAEDEVNPVLSTAVDNGMAVTSLGNDYIFEEPRILFMDISELGEPIALAGKLERIRETIKTIRAASPVLSSQGRAGITPSKNSLNASDLDSILLAHGEVVNGTYKVSMGMAGTIFGVPVGKQAGLRTSITFAGTNENAIVDGQIIVTPNQIRSVLRTLRKGGVDITALHNHFIESNPEFYFIHFFGAGPAPELAMTVRQAMETQLK